jgi:hypothetical protein
MSTNTQKPAGKAGVFRVIEGGLSKAETTEPVVTAGQLPGEVEAERLRQAIVRLQVPGTGLTVTQALDEVDAKLHSTQMEHIERSSRLLDSMEQHLGLRYQLANPDLELAREGFLNLTWPDRLLAAHPELAGLHPKAHPYLALG